jgi:thymidylate synthase
MNSYSGEKGYLQLLVDTLNNSEKRNTRNGIVYSVFGIMITFDISRSFPLLTTKKMFTKGIIHELLWFLRGSTNSKDLENDGVNIWKLNSSRDFLDGIGLTNYAEGELGPVYGWQWRSFNAPYPTAPHTGVDQLRYVLQELMAPNNSRRAVITGWNPCQLHQMALPPCHILYTFYKDSKGLSCMMNMRSSDLFLGLPFNIASVALLTHIIAKVLHLNVANVAITATDAHIYKEHIDAIKKQIENPIYDHPKLLINADNQPPSLESSIDDKIKWIENLKYTDFVFLDYQSAGAIKAPIK